MAGERIMVIAYGSTDLQNAAQHHLQILRADMIREQNNRMVVIPHFAGQPGFEAIMSVTCYECWSVLMLILSCSV